MNTPTVRLIALLLALLLCGAPQVLAQAAQSQDPPQQQEQEPQPPGDPTLPDTGYDPNQAPVETPLPDAPSAAQEQPQQQQPAAARVPPQQPVGAATAEKGRTVGGAASRPAGTAIAPAKQPRKWSWLIKLGAIAGAGAALGTVYALSKSTPSTPPGSTSGVRR